MMDIQSENSAVVGKTRELCQTILNQPEFKELQAKVDAFMADEDAKSQYQTVSEQGQYLQHKQQQGVELSEQEVEEFNQKRDSLLNNAVVKDFLDAQQAMQEVQQSVGQFVGKTFELGRVPKADDFESGSCGSGCGCH